MCHSVETGTNNICNLGNIIPHGGNYAVSVLSMCLMYCTSNILRMLFHIKICWSLQTYYCTSVRIVLMPCCSGLIYVMVVQSNICHRRLICSYIGTSRDLHCALVKNWHSVFHSDWAEIIVPGAELYHMWIFVTFTNARFSF